MEQTDSGAKPVKIDKTSAIYSFCTSLSFVGLSIHAAVSGLAGPGRRFPRRHRLAAPVRSSRQPVGDA
jgi:hypothetical protein